MTPELLAEMEAAARAPMPELRGHMLAIMNQRANILALVVEVRRLEGALRTVEAATAFSRRPCRKVVAIADFVHAALAGEPS